MAKTTKELESAAIAATKMQEQMSALTQDAMQSAPLHEVEAQTKMTKKQVEEYDAPVIRATKSMPSTGKALPQEAQAREDGWKYIKCIAENNEVVGEMIEFWYKKFSGDPIYFWQVPVNKPIYLPKHVAQHISDRKYHVMKMQSKPIHEVAFGEPMDRLVCQETRRRLDCRSVQFGF
ncbi:MAG TPA: hypothetical protein VFX43_09400 [Chitinophagaceae bacterium]|nr:hypothetical protein [Chitinophagaceae bacterium]